MARTIVIQIGYIGTNYNGFQKQKETDKTIQGIIEKALYCAFNQTIKVVGASRTDKKVHAACQMIMFQEVEHIETSKYVYILNNELPFDIRAYKAYSFLEDDNFHARYSCRKKIYVYKIDTNRVPILKEIPFSLHFPLEINREKMKRALKTIEGEHNFKGFASKHSKVDNCVRNIFKTEFLEGSNGMIEIRIVGNGFLHNMVRIIVGSLLDIGRGNLKEDIFLQVYKSKKRRDLGKTANPKGLLLENIEYDKI